jgi:hypothetical protein
MRLVLSIFLGVLCASCSTVEPKCAKAIALPKLTVEGVSFSNGLQEQEAVALSSEYFRRFISGCGMPDKPQDVGSYWRVQLWGGYAGTDYGTLRFAKDGSDVLLSPPRGGFKSATRHLLRHQNVSYE